MDYFLSPSFSNSQLYCSIVNQTDSFKDELLQVYDKLESQRNENLIRLIVVRHYDSGTAFILPTYISWINTGYRQQPLHSFKTCYEKHNRFCYDNLHARPVGQNMVYLLPSLHNKKEVLDLSLNYEEIKNNNSTVVLVAQTIELYKKSYLLNENMQAGLPEKSIEKKPKI